MRASGGGMLAAHSVEKDVEDRINHSGQRVVITADDPVGRHLVKRAEEDLGDDSGIELRSKEAGQLAGLDDLSNNLEILCQFCGGELFHELYRLAQFDLKDDGHVAVVFEALEMQTGELAQLIARVGEPGELGPGAANEFVHRGGEDGSEEVVLVFEIEIDGAIGDAGFAGNVGDFGIKVAGAREYFSSRAQDLEGLLGACRAFAIPFFGQCFYAFRIRNCNRERLSENALNEPSFSRSLVESGRWPQGRLETYGFRF